MVKEKKSGNYEVLIGCMNLYAMKLQDKFDEKNENNRLIDPAKLEPAVRFFETAKEAVDYSFEMMRSRYRVLMALVENPENDWQEWIELLGCHEFVDFTGDEPVFVRINFVGCCYRGDDFYRFEESRTNPPIDANANNPLAVQLFLHMAKEYNCLLGFDWFWEKRNAEYVEAVIDSGNGYPLYDFYCGMLELAKEHKIPGVSVQRVTIKNENPDTNREHYPDDVSYDTEVSPVSLTMVTFDKKLLHRSH